MNRAAAERARVQGLFPGATVSSRGRGYILHAHPSVPGRYILATAVGGGDYHFGNGPYTQATEIDTAWIDATPLDNPPYTKKMALADYHAFAFPGNSAFNTAGIVQYRHPSSGQTVSFTAMQLQWTNDLSQIQAIGDPATVSPTIADDKITWSNAFGPGRHFHWRTHPTRLIKLLEISSLASLPAPTIGNNPVLKLQFQFLRSAGVSLWIDGVQWDERPTNPRTTTANVEFRLTATGAVLWTFQTPVATDGSGLGDITGTATYRRQGPNLLVEILVPWSWLQTAVYPVFIDPTINTSIAAGGDDGYAQSGNSSLNTNATSTYAGYHTVGTIAYRDPYMRFTSGISGLSGATINTATLSIDTITNSASVVKLVRAEDVAAPAAPTSYANFTGKVRTTASVAFPTGVDPSFSVATIVQELADSYDPSAIQFLWEDNGQSTGGTAHAQIATYENTSGTAANLYIDYTAASTVRIPRAGFVNFQNPGIV